MKLAVVLNGLLVVGELVDPEELGPEVQQSMQWTKSQKGAMLKNAVFPAHPELAPLTFFWVNGTEVDGHGVL